MQSAAFALAAVLFLAVSGPALADTCRAGGPPHYAVENSVVTYDFYDANTRLTSADPATFKPLSLPPHRLGPCEHTADEFYGADRTHVFYEGSIIPGADPATFRPLAEYEYAEDKTAVFYQGKRLQGADPASFRLLLWPGEASLKRPPGEKFSVYAADSRHVWEQGRPMPGLDAATFTLLPMGYAKDKNGVYRDDRLVPGLDPKTFDGIERH